MSDEDLPQETEETLNEKAGISVLTIDNSENVSTMTENCLPDMETTTLASSIASIATSFNNSRNNIPTTPSTTPIQYQFPIKLSVNGPVVSKKIISPGCDALV